jgi:hypothetical protein
MRENIEKMEQFPFDGLVFHATSGNGENLSWEVWGGRKYIADDFTQAIENLKTTKFSRFTDRFLRVNVTPAKVDWFDDSAWANVADNFGVAAKVAKEGRCIGFMFDTEQYEGVTVFDYRRQKDKRTFAEYQVKVRQRGREWATAVRLCTSKEALQRFFDRLSGNQQVVTPPTITSRQRLRQIQRAEEELRRAGI